jgi:hypothetical protein
MSGEALTHATPKLTHRGLAACSHGNEHLMAADPFGDADFQHRGIDKRNTDTLSPTFYEIEEKWQ